MGKRKLEGLRSQWKWGVASETRKGLILGMGYTEDELDRPLIAVVNSWNEYNPGHVHLNQLAERVKQGIREAGGLPFEVMTTGICDGMVLIDPKYIEIPSRNCIADQVELTVEGNFFDGMVMLSTCDSIVPGHLMAAARLDIPTIIVTGGYMPHTFFRGKEVYHMDGQHLTGAAESGDVDMDYYNDIIRSCYGACGACDALTTANSMCTVAEALGMTLPGNSSMSAVSPAIRRLSFQAGKRIVELVEEGVTARQIITPESIKNAIRVDMAMAGSANLILHIPAIASEAGYDEPWWSYFDQLGQEIPLLCHTAPSGPWKMTDIDRAGGMPALFKELLPKMNCDCMTVSGKTFGEVYKDYPVWDHEVIHSLDDPASTEPGMAVLYGSLAPEGCFVKIAGVPEHMVDFRGPAVVFDDLEDSIEGLRNGKIKPGDAAILRFMGLKGRFGTTAFTFQEELKGHPDLYNSCAIITDGRYSGGTTGLSVGYVCPEAAQGGPLGVVKDGDMIHINLAERTMDLDIPEAELKERLDNFHWDFPSGQHKRYLNFFVRNIGSAARGSIWEFKD